MGIIDTLLGRSEPQTAPTAPPVQTGTVADSSRVAGNTDAQAVARYRYMLQTAPPESIEQAHTDAFTKLTPEQRRLALQQLADVTPENERGSLADDPQSLARAATRAEVRQPGVLERTFAGGGGGMGMMGGGGMGMGGLLAGGLLTSVAGSFIGSSIAHQFFSDPQVVNNFYETNPDMGGHDASDNTADGGNNLAENNAPADNYADAGSGDSLLANQDVDAGSDFGGDIGGDFGGDF